LFWCIRAELLFVLDARHELELGNLFGLEKQPVSYFPIYLEMTGRRCLVVGGGTVAERKIASLLEVAAEVTVISPDVTETIAGWAKNNSIQLKARRYRPGDLADFELVFVATDDGELNAQVYEEGKSRAVWVNAADDPAHCDFILPSVLRRGELTVAVSSGGNSPALARTIREELELHFTAEYAMLTELAGNVRDELRRRSITVPFEIWRKALSGGEVRQLLVQGDLAQAKSRLLRDLGVSP
jgi:precorrin-2 dehydrogenase / sirohydrochlorin ferrochelatase